MYALVEYKGKQYKAEKDGLIQVDKLDAEKGQTVDIDTVIMLSDGADRNSLCKRGKGFGGCGRFVPR